MRGVSRLVGSGTRTPNRVTTGPEPGAEAASVAADRVARGAGQVLAGIAGRLAAVGRPPQGIADGHTTGIEADRAEPPT